MRIRKTGGVRDRIGQYRSRYLRDQAGKHVKSVSENRGKDSIVVRKDARYIAGVIKGSSPIQRFNKSTISRGKESVLTKIIKTHMY